MQNRSRTRQIRLGSLPIGGDAPIVVQSMTNTDTRDVEATFAQIRRLERCGCEAVRVAILDKEAVGALARLRAMTDTPLIADIHFDSQLAVSSAEAGAAGLRINPGNIGSDQQISRVVDAARANGAVIRIGVNSGSLEKDLLARYGHPCPQALAESALRHVRQMEKRNFGNIKVSLKSSSVLQTVEAYRLFRQSSDYPLHIGVTEAGSRLRGAVKSAVGLGILLQEGIGDTIRVSLTGDPEDEIGVAYEILRALGLRRRGPEIISCPTCGRTEINLQALVEEVEKALRECQADLTVAVMGCVVNGPGEAREADVGIAGGRDKGLIFRKGMPVRSVHGHQAMTAALLEEIAKVVREKTVPKP